MDLGNFVRVQFVDSEFKNYKNTFSSNRALRTDDFCHLAFRIDPIDFVLDIGTVNSH